jgi:Zn-dependent membrane protease YugP
MLEDPMFWVFVLPGLLLGLYAQSRIKLNVTKYSQVPRSYIVPIMQLASQAAPWLFIIGLMLQLETLTWAGIILFASSFLLAFLTLPVELNASARAKELLVSHGIIQGDEQIAGVEKVLGAAAWTYVAAAVSAIGVWLFYVFILFFRGRSEAGQR